jgi:hypothetical protein
MLYLSGAVRDELPDHGIGWLMTPNMGNRPKTDRAWYWGADTGCFSKTYDFRVGEYLEWLREREDLRPWCLFATAPDVVGNAAQTAEFAREILPVIRGLDYPAALVAQDGLERLHVPWDTFDVLFLGGSTEWKLGPAAARLTRQARERGKWVHMGRVNSYKRIRYAAEIGCDSADGTFIAFGAKKNVPQVVKWYRKLEEEGLQNLHGMPQAC